MTGHNNLCGRASSLDASTVPICGQQDPFILTLGQPSNGGGRNYILKQDVANLAIRHKSPKADLCSGFPVSKVQVNAELSSGDVSYARPITSGCSQGSVSSQVSEAAAVAVKYGGVPDKEPGIIEHANGNVELALTIVPYTEPVTLECVTEFAGSCTPFDNPIPTELRHLAYPAMFSTPDIERGRPCMPTLQNPPRQSTTARFFPGSNSHRYIHDHCLSQLDDANQAAHNIRVDNFLSHISATRAECLAQPSTADQAPEDNVPLDNFASHGQAIREQSFPAFVSTTGTKAVDKKQLTGLPLPDSLARSFDSSEMDKITKAIVRVNDFGSSLAKGKKGNMPAFAQEPGDGREIGSLKKITPRVLPSVGAFTVQCAKCFKWRLVPSKEQYEQIRQYILEKPFFCSSTSIWQPGASCDDPPELCEDANFVWAIDKPNIPLAPSGWERLLVIRSEGCSKFADIYYVAPSGKKLRSMPEIERYLSEHPELVNTGVNLSQFSFVIPKALDENYCRKKTSGSSTVMRGSITHKGTPCNLGVRSQPLKVPYVRRFPAGHFDHNCLVAQPLETRQPAIGQASVNYPENGPLAVEPLRAWDPDNHVIVMQE